MEIILHSKQEIHVLEKVYLNKRPGGSDVLTDPSLYFNRPYFEILA
jgi:hypothetical protein